MLRDEKKRLTENREARQVREGDAPGMIRKSVKRFSEKIMP
jgi:hypothetical protein